ncbi:MAG TPA: GatB/YqeY domain-containing protein [Alphaproteobacteria bacterium]
MPSLPERLRAAMNEARKTRDQARTLLLSTILSDIQNRDFELRHPASDEDAAEVLRRGVKRRRESIEHYEKGQRPELAAKERAEIRMLEEFLPAAVPPEEIRAAVREAIAAGAQDAGKVMGQVMPRFKGRADGKVVNQIVREELAG